MAKTLWDLVGMFRSFTSRHDCRAVLVFGGREYLTGGSKVFISALNCLLLVGKGENEPLVAASSRWGRIQEGSLLKQCPAYLVERAAA